jgi:UDP-N-acetylglucosamine 1-carboxyvinyltransferase
LPILADGQNNLDKIIIAGGNPLSGEIEISGAKNAALPILAATLLSSEPQHLKRIPQVVDLFTMQKLLRAMGAKISEQNVTTPANDICTIEVNQIESCEARYEWVKTMRATVLVLGPLLARCGEANVSLPGGCAIGVRPVNLHLAALSQMGAEIFVEHGMIHAKAKKLRGAEIHFETVTVTGTENIMMAATLAEGTTVLTNAAMEPEITDLACFLKGCGAKITGAGTSRIVIEGVSRLTGSSYSIMPDRIEAGTFMVAAAITGGDLTLRDCLPDQQASVTRLLKKTGVEITHGKSSLRIRRPFGKAIHAVDFITTPYPGFPTDMQAQMMALMAVSDGLSKITEAIFESRFAHAAELRRMGAKIYLEGNHAIVEGVKTLSGAPVMASDLRASSSLILAGLAAEGETEISRVYHLDRGYEKIEQKLLKVGADIRRVKSP